MKLQLLECLQNFNHSNSIYKTTVMVCTQFIVSSNNNPITDLFTIDLATFSHVHSATHFSPQWGNNTSVTHWTSFLLLVIHIATRPSGASNSLIGKQRISSFLNHLYLEDIPSTINQEKYVSLTFLMTFININFYLFVVYICYNCGWSGHIFNYYKKPRKLIYSKNILDLQYSDDLNNTTIINNVNSYYGI